MKLREELILGQIAGEYVVLASGDELDLSKMTTLNETGKFIWEQLEQETTQEAVVEALLGEYDVSREVATEKVAAFLEKLREFGFLAE